MRLLIAGGRDFDDYERVRRVCEPFLSHELEIVQGGARGADALGSRFAEEHQIPEKQFDADWATHGRAAGILRNLEMAKYATVLVAFWDGKSRGTGDMINRALAWGLEVHVYRY